MTWLSRLIAFLRPHRPLTRNSVQQPVIRFVSISQDAIDAAVRGD